MFFIFYKGEEMGGAYVPYCFPYKIKKKGCQFYGEARRWKDMKSD